MRDITPAVAAECAQPQVRLAFFCQLQFKNSTEYLWSGYGTIAWNGQNWLGMGHLGSIGVITEDTTLAAQGFTLGLAGVDTNMLAEARDEVQQGLPARLWLAFFDENGSIISNPILCMAGLIDQVTLDIGADKSTISLAIENPLVDLQRPCERRFTDQDQRMVYPNDSGFAYVAQLMDWNSAWGVESK